MGGAAETIGATVNAAAIAIYRMVESDIRTVVTADDGACFGLFENLNSGRGRLTNPLDGVIKPGIRRVRDVTHTCNLVLSTQHSIRGSDSGFKSWYARIPRTGR